MVDVNITVKVPAFEKLVDVVASGIGAVAGPILAPWMARQDAKAKLIEVGAQAIGCTTDCRDCWAEALLPDGQATALSIISMLCFRVSIRAWHPMGRTNWGDVCPKSISATTGNV